VRLDSIRSQNIHVPTNEIGHGTYPTNEIDHGTYPTNEINHWTDSTKDIANDIS